MHPAAVSLIIEEHHALRTVMRALVASVARARQRRSRPDFDTLRAMLSYLDEMPAHHHHVLESHLLFPRLRERCPALRPVLDRLEAEHDHGELNVRDLACSLQAWESGGDARFEAFEALLRVYSDTYLGHMEVEENYILPVAMDYLSAADWRELEDAFARQRGALSDKAMGMHQALFDRIVAPQTE